MLLDSAPRLSATVLVGFFLMAPASFYAGYSGTHWLLYVPVLLGVGYLVNRVVVAGVEPGLEEIEEDEHWDRHFAAEERIEECFHQHRYTILAAFHELMRDAKQAQRSASQEEVGILCRHLISSTVARELPQDLSLVGVEDASEMLLDWVGDFADGDELNERFEDSWRAMGEFLFAEPTQEQMRAAWRRISGSRRDGEHARTRFEEWVEQDLWPQFNAGDPESAEVLRHLSQGPATMAEHGLKVIGVPPTSAASVGPQAPAASAARALSEPLERSTAGRSPSEPAHPSAPSPPPLSSFATSPPAKTARGQQAARGVRQRVTVHLQDGGWTVEEVTDGIRGGSMLRARKGDRTALVAVREKRRAVRRSAVLQAHSAKGVQSADVVAIVALGGFAPEAEEDGRVLGVILLHAQDIGELDGHLAAN
jgi:hypothetical protein